MADKSVDYEITTATPASPAQMNARLLDINARIQRLEEQAGFSVSIHIDGPVTNGTSYAIVPIPAKLQNVEVAIGCAVLPGGANLDVDVRKNGEPGGGSPGTSLFAVAGDRPVITPTTFSGKSTFKPATQGMPIADGDALRIDVVTAGVGPAEDITVVIRGEPVA